jgi:37-kD nucleoid-associated bacterial protein
LLVLELSIGAETYFDIIKFDHDPGVGYDLKQQGDQVIATLKAINDQFSKRKEAMQKSALIRLGPDDGGAVFAIDRAGGSDITGQFQNFLDVYRELTHKEISERLCKALYKTGTKHQKDLPAEKVKGMRHRINSTLLALGQYHPNQLGELKAAIYGPLAEDHPLHATLEAQLKRQKVANEPVIIDSEALPKARQYVKETNEGIRVTIPKDQIDKVDVQDIGGGQQYLRIKTTGLKHDDVEFEKTS